jgi:hypothetical protein
MFKYKNVSPHHLTVPNVGEVDPGETLESEGVLESQHLELVTEPGAPRIAPASAAPAVSAPAPVATIPAQAAPVNQEVS